MSLASDYVTVYRQQIGAFQTARANLATLHAFLADAGNLLNDPTAFEGTNSDLVKADLTQAQSAITAAEGVLDRGKKDALNKVAGRSGLPKLQ